MNDETIVEPLSYLTFFDDNKFNRNKVKENWVKSHFPIDYSNIQSFNQIQKNKLDTFSQKVYHYLFKIDHIPFCVKCGTKHQRFKGFNLGYNPFCSKKCASSNSFKSGYEKRVRNTIEKHGVSHTTMLKSVRDKIKSTNIRKLGVEHASQSKDVLNKMKKTNMVRYGVEYPMQNKSIYEKSLVKINSNNLVNNPKIRETIKRNSLKNNGCEWPIQSKDVKEKIKESKNISISSSIRELYLDSDEVEFLEYRDSISKFRCRSCDSEFNISSSLLYQRHTKHKITICTNCNKLNDNVSSGHLEISKYLDSIGVEYQMNVRNIISPYEIDIYIPSHSLGIEFNGVYWHSEIIKDKKYHIKKKDDCKSKDINLIQIWEDDWKYKKDIIKSILSSRFGKSQSVKWARKLSIRKINDENLVKEFLTINHLQGWALSSIKYGLFDGPDIISIMTFSKSRLNVNNKDWELVRFCNKLNHTVLGSFNRLLSRFISESSPSTLISYSDNDIFNGESYERFNMVKSSESENYWWCDGRIRHNRWKFRKDVLVKEGYGISLSGTQIMIDRGYFRCWGSGTTKWIWYQSSDLL